MAIRLQHTTIARPKAARAFQFLGQPYYSLPHLAIAMGRNWAQAIDQIKKKPLSVWIRRSRMMKKRPRRLKSC
jgi:hypothetical protein